MSSNANGPVFLLTPGSFATPIAYTRPAEALRAKGYDAQIIDLLSVGDGTRQPPATMEDDAAHIRKAILSVIDGPNPRDVILAPHSYSGIPTTCAAKGLDKKSRQAEGKSTAVTGIIYLTSFILSEGESLRSIMAEFDALPEPLLSGVPGGYLPQFPKEFAPVVFNDLSAEDGLKFLGYMAQHASDSYDGKVSYAAWKDIPCVTMIPSIDSVVPVPMQEAMYERAVKAGGSIERILVEGAGHGLPVSRTDLVVEQMIKLANRV
ncbi:hypothetical protein PENSTE_c004G09508 [Penicillium steckii]|uniref:AB hydrolase-1 domain-containing protein n=1 Tax=Penicillium steckii TaxID=303698 RepID=A0A1V6TPB3_9EURO|nr:hypothetical protein PENSTE_c004G09508 [Penicillium steckii]